VTSSSYETVEIDVFGFKIVEIVEAAPSEVLSTSGHVKVWSTLPLDTDYFAPPKAKLKP